MSWEAIQLYIHLYIYIYIYTGTTKTSMSQPRIRFGGLPKLHSASSQKNEAKKRMLSKNQVPLPQSFYFGGHFRPFSPCLNDLGRFPHQLLRQVLVRRTVGRPRRILAPKQEVSPSHRRRLAADGMSRRLPARDGVGSLPASFFDKGQMGEIFLF